MTEVNDDMGEIELPLVEEKPDLLQWVYDEIKSQTGLNLQDGSEATDSRVWGSHAPVLRRLLKDCCPLKSSRLRVLELGMGPTSTIDVFADALGAGDIDLFSLEEGTNRTFFDILDEALLSVATSSEEAGELKTWFYPQKPKGTPEAAELERLAPTIDLVFIDSVASTEGDTHRRRSWRHFAFSNRIPVIVLHDSSAAGCKEYAIRPETSKALENGYRALEFLSTDSPKRTATAVLWLDGCAYDLALRGLKTNPPEKHELSTDPMWKSKQFGIG